MYLLSRSRCLLAVFALLLSATAQAHKPTSDHSKADHYHPDKNAKSVAKKPQASAKKATKKSKKDSETFTLPAEYIKIYNETGYHAVTVYLDAKWGRRTKGAAKSITASHKKWASKGYRLQDVDLYTENSDLKGFFITYIREKP